MQGWIKLHRGIITHWIFKDADKLKAWITILASVNHSEKKVVMGESLFVVKRGESIKSLDTWAKLFGTNWNKSKVRRFFKLLESDSMIVTKSERKTTRLTVCKYEDYQGERNDNETILKRKRNDSETIVTPNNNVKKEKKDNTTKSYDYAEESKIFNSISNLFDSKYYNTDAKKTKWLDVIRLLHTADGYSYSLIESVIAYAKADDFWSTNVLSILNIRTKKNDVSKFDNIKAKFDGSGTVQRKQLNAKLKYATPTEMLKHFDNEQAMNDSLQTNTYVSNGEKIFPLRSKDGTRNKEGDYIIGADRQLYKITV